MKNGLEPTRNLSGSVPGALCPGEDWRAAAASEDLGWSSAQLAEARAYAREIGSAAVMIVDRGVVVDAWGDIARNFHAHSMRKSLLSALYGIYVAEGKIDLSKTLQELGIDDCMPLTEAEKRATVTDLLKARSGVYIPAVGESALMQAIRPARGSHPPGAYWYYNNWDFNALGTIFDRATGEVSIYQAFKMRIADPIGIQDLAVQELRYTYQPDSMHPYYGFAMSARDLARFGLLFARRGRWGDRQIVPASWVLESTSPHSNAGALGGYGYLWWVAANKRHLPNVTLPDGCFSMQGGPGQFVLVLPAWDIVIVHLVDSYHPTNEVSNCQFGSLARLILKASTHNVGLEIPKVGERVELDEAELARFVGQYDGQTIPVPLSVEQNGGDLTAMMPPEGPFVLVPVTPTRLLIENWPGAHIEFTVDGNRISAATIVLSGPHRLLFKPKQQALAQAPIARKRAMAKKASPPRIGVNKLDTEPAAKFEAEMRMLREKLKIPGLSVAVVQDQQVVFARGLGCADLENQIPATENTPYNLASCTKPIAAVVLMQLVEAGKLDLDAAMAEVLRDAVFPMRYRAQDGSWVEVRGYQAFCKGLHEIPLLRDDYQNYHCDTERVTVRHHLTHTAEGVPGEAYRYNGDLYSFLSLVVEAVSGVGFVDLLVERVVRPLQMTRTVPSLSQEHRDRVLAERTKYYRVNDQGDFVQVEVERPIRWPAEFKDGGLLLDPSFLINTGDGVVSTVLDLARFDVALDQHRLLSPETQETMWTPTLSNSGQPLPYGLGWFVQLVNGRKLVWHYGYGGDHSSLILKLPQEDLTLILLANSDRASAGLDLGSGNVLRSPFATAFINRFTGWQVQQE